MSLRIPDVCVLRALCAAVVFLLAACSDETPTAVGPETISGDRPVTYEVVIPADTLVSVIGRFDGYSSAVDAPFLLVANDFGGTLNAHSLARFTGAPREISFSDNGTTRTDTVFTYTPGTLLAPVDTLASVAAGARLQLWALDQAWTDSAANWERATDTTLWSEPGGTRGELLAEADAGSAGDTLRFALDSLQVARVLAADFPGVLITATGAPGRIRLGRLVLRTALRPGSRPDTAVERTFAEGPQRFIYTPAPPFPATAWPVGGVQSARTLLRLRLPTQVSTCDSGAPAGSCGPLALRDVTINSARLVLRPVPSPPGFAPLGRYSLQLLRVFDTELGRQAPLGPIFADTAAISSTGGVLFASPSFVAGDTTVEFAVGQPLQTLIRQDSTSVSIALVGQPNAGNFAAVWFAPAPTLHVIYTVPAPPRLP